MSKTPKPPTKRRMGRPPGVEHHQIVHLRLSDDLKAALERIRETRRDGPTLSALIRLAVVEYIDREESK